MAKVVDLVDHYKILETHKDYIVINTKGSYNNHGHFDRLAACYTIIKLIKRRTIPNKPYMIEAAKRITTDEAYKENLLNKQKKNKQRQYYFNPNKGVRR